jgi:hypothetical protein
MFSLATPTSAPVDQIVDVERVHELQNTDPVP